MKLGQTNTVSERILVTGGAGFVGSHLVDRLLSGGHEVFCLDNASTGSFANVAMHSDNPNFTVVQANVQNAIELNIDKIFHLACPASPVHYQNDPVNTFKTCVLGTMNVLELARAQDCPVLVASTSEIYGDPLQHPQREGYWGNVNPIGPRSCYDEGKRAAETLCHDYHQQYGTQARIVRIFNTYGPRMDQSDGRVVSNFIVQALKGEPITLYGDGSQTRSFCYVSDLVSGLICAMNSPAMGFGPVNLGNPTENTVAELAQEVIKMTGSRSDLVLRPLPQDDPTRRNPDITRARDLLDWEPQVDLRTGLQHTIAHFEKALEEAVV